MAEYALWLTTDKGVRLEALNRATWWQASRQVNRIGQFAMGLPTDLAQKLERRNHLRRDNMLQVWRAPAGRRMNLYRVYFLRGWRWANENNRETLTLFGPDCNDLLRRRIAAHYFNETNTNYSSTEADDVMKSYVTDAITDGSNPTPTLGGRDSWDLSVQGDLGNGPSIDFAAAWRPLLTPAGGGILPEIAATARDDGTEVFFDIVVDSLSPTSISFEFRTYTGQPGADMTARAVFSQEGRNLRDPFIEYDYSEEINYIYAGSPGVFDARRIDQRYDEDRINASAWNRCEGFGDAREGGGISYNKLRALLDETKPNVWAGGIPVDTPSTTFGYHWNHGDKVRMKYRNQEFDCIVRSTVLSMRDGEETIDARLEYES